MPASVIPTQRPGLATSCGPLASEGSKEWIGASLFFPQLATHWKSAVGKAPEKVDSTTTCREWPWANGKAEQAGWAAVSYWAWKQG